jgi:ABC-2 type transport system ATP-binding protein
VDSGQILGLLGPNGAGKSTTMNILTGYLSATEGQVLIGGVDILTDPIAAKKKIGYLPELPPLYMEMTVQEYLSFVCDLKGVKKYRQQQINEVCEHVRITHVRDRLIKNLSKGYRQRVGLAQALINNPELIVLDEPTVGLDPKEIIEICNLIKMIGKTHTVIFSSHILSEVQSVCDRIVVINRGNLIANDTPENLYKSLSQANRLMVRVMGPEEPVFRLLESVKGVAQVNSLGQKEPQTFDFALETDGVSDIRPALFRALAKQDWPLLSLRGSEVSLEDIFLELTRESEVQ